MTNISDSFVNYRELPESTVTLHPISFILYHVLIMEDKIVITGTGLVSSLGSTPSETWDALVSNQCGVKQIEDFNSEGFECNTAAQVQGLNAEKLNVHPRDSRIMDKHSYMLLKASRDAFNHSGLNNGSVASEEIGYFAGMGMVDYNIEDLLPSTLKSLDSKKELDLDRFFSHAYQEIHPLWPLSMLNNISFCQVAIDMDIKGENTVFSPHADSGAHAIIEAYNSVAEEKSLIALAGGVSEKVSPLSVTRALLSGILNKEGTTCMPFGKNRKGSILGEGCGIIALELQSSAEKRNVPCHAALTGYGSAFEAENESPCPTPKAISRSMEDAIKYAGLKPSEIDLIIAHGDGTFQGDKNETDAINRTFTDCIDQINVYSSKAALGHLLAGAPATDIILGIHIMKNGIIPAIHNAMPQDEKIRFNTVTEGPLTTNVKRILINSCSSEGQCASLIIEAID